MHKSSQVSLSKKLARLKRILHKKKQFCSGFVFTAFDQFDRFLLSYHLRQKAESSFLTVLKTRKIFCIETASLLREMY